MPKKITLIIEDDDKMSYRTRLNDVLNKYDKRIINIDTGAIPYGYSERGLVVLHYYAIIIVEE